MDTKLTKVNKKRFIKKTKNSPRNQWYEARFSQVVTLSPSKLQIPPILNQDFHSYPHSSGVVPDSSYSRQPYRHNVSSNIHPKPFQLFSGILPLLPLAKHRQRLPRNDHVHQNCVRRRIDAGMSWTWQ